jgi:hypothetical protein
MSPFDSSFEDGQMRRLKLGEFSTTGQRSTGRLCCACSLPVRHDRHDDPTQ